MKSITAHPPPPIRSEVKTLQTIFKSPQNIHCVTSSIDSVLFIIYNFEKIFYKYSTVVS